MAPAQRHTKPNTSREAAVQALIQVHGGAYANLAAKSVLAGTSLPQRDTAFAGALFYGTCERLITLDALISPFSKRPIAKLDAEVRAILETGLYQLLYMQVPQSAAVNEAVKLCRRFGKSSASGFVNAVLRKLSALCVQPGFNPVKHLAPKDETQRVMLQYSVSKAVAKAVMQALPDEYDAFFTASFGTAAKIGRQVSGQGTPPAAEQNTPMLALRPNTLKTTPQALARLIEEQGGHAQPGPVPGSLAAHIPGAVAASPLFQNGLFHVQGFASQYACLALDAQPGDTVLDLCAAPGGKSATLAQYIAAPGGEAGAGLTSCDIHPHRVQLIRETLARLSITAAKVLQNDATVYNESLAGQDRVLCDVPCSGLGVLGKKPDLRLSTGEGFAALPALQLQILSTAARYVKPGGRLVYSTCTILPQENSGVAEAFLAKTPCFAPVKLPQSPSGCIETPGSATFLPNRTGLDGFYVASFERMC